MKKYVNMFTHASNTFYLNPKLTKVVNHCGNLIAPGWVPGCATVDWGTAEVAGKTPVALPTGVVEAGGEPDDGGPVIVGLIPGGRAPGAELEPEVVDGGVPRGGLPDGGAPWGTWRSFRKLKQS